MSDKSGFQAREFRSRCYESRCVRFMAQFVDSLVAAAVGSGDKMFDVACGVAARAAAVAIGPTGRVLGSDLTSQRGRSEHE